MLKTFALHQECFLFPPLIVLSVSQKNCHQDWKEEKTKARVFRGGIR